MIVGAEIAAGPWQGAAAGEETRHLNKTGPKSQFCGLIPRKNADSPACAAQTWTADGPCWLRAVAGGFCAGLRR